MNNLAETHYITHSNQLHCATVCPYWDGVAIAYYSGPECSNQQRVHIRYQSGGVVRAKLTLYPKTGNCILCPTESGNMVLIYSYFNDTDGYTVPTSPVGRWAYCSNWKVKIDKNFKLDTYEPLPTQPATGYLVRCSPIKVNNEWILPMYRENPAYGLIMKSTDGWNWRTAGTIGMSLRHGLGTKTRGHNLMQPSLWYDGTTLHSLSRNSGRLAMSYAHYSSSADFGETWSTPSTTKITNTNNSLAVISDDATNPWMIWNYGSGRSILALGQLSGKEAIANVILNRGASGSYPNYCFDVSGRLHIVHTEQGRIAHHILYPGFYEKLKNYELQKITEIQGWKINQPKR